MKTYCMVLLLILAGNAVFSQKDNSGYDKALADSLGADDYGMKVYVLVILKKGPAVIDRKEERDSLFRGHMENINRLAENKKLIVAGPFFENDKNYSGIFILNVSTIEEAKLLTETDPAINAKVFEVELYKWYGSAALPVYLREHGKIEKKAP